MHDVVVNEDQLQENAEALLRWCTAAEERFAHYLDALSYARLFVFKKGEFAENLSSYAAYAKKLQHQFDNWGSDFGELTWSYIREIDTVDDLR